MTTTCLHCGSPMQSQRSTKKYCSDNCKQLAFYKRSGLALVNDDEDLPLSDKQHIEKEPVENEVALIQSYQQEFNEQFAGDLPLKSLNDEHAVTVNNSFTVKPEQNEPSYKCVFSKMIYSIADYVDNSEALFMFQHPGDYWSIHTLLTVKWVSLRLRCLLERLIKLSNFSQVDYDNIVAIKEAFTALIESGQFKRLPSNYPFTILIKEMEQKLALIAKQHKYYESIRFRLTTNRKVEFIAIRFMLADFVPSIKFSELDFTE
jgi:hypothetical protein